MEITLLGSGANECIPAFRCKCPICTNALKHRGKEIRQNSCALIERSHESSLLIDMPPQILSLLSNANIDSCSIKDILITHCHEDHILGARYLFQGRPAKGFNIQEKANIYMPETAFSAMSGKFRYMKSPSLLKMKTDNYEIHLLKPYRTFSIGMLEITPVETNHLDESYGYIIEDNKGLTTVYLLDAAKVLPERTMKILEQKQIDLIVVDCTYKETSEDSGHSDIEGILKLNSIIKPKKMILSHIGHRNMTHKDLVTAMASTNIMVGFDGMKAIM